MAVTDANEISTRVERLEALLEANQRRLDLLARRVLDLEEKRTTEGTLPAPLEEPFAPEDDRPWSSTGRARFFVQVAAVAFALVLALVLRTLSDANVIGTGAGMALGLAYAATLLFGGARMRRRGHPAGIVLAICGAMLPSMLVLDANVRFAVLGPIGAASVLAATVVLATATAHRLRAPALAESATVVAIVAGLAAGWPDLAYPLVAALLGIAAIAAAVMHADRARPWLEWPVLFATLLMWFAWSFRLNRGLADPTTSAAPWQNWFTLSLVATAVLHLALALPRLHRGDRPAGAHAASIPTVTVLWTAAAAASVPGLAPTAWTGIAFAALAALLALLAHVLLRREGAEISGRVGALLIGTLTAAFVAAWSLAPSPGPALAVWLASTAAVTWMVRAHQQPLPWLVSAGAASTTLLATALHGGAATAATWTDGAITAGIALLAHLLHRGLTTRVVAGSNLARSIVSLAAICILFTAACAVCFTAQTVAVHIWPELSETWLPALRSTMLATLATVLMLRGARWSRDHVRIGYAALVALGAKTVVHDLWNVQGLPLVVGVLLLGTTAVAAAIAARRPN